MIPFWCIDMDGGKGSRRREGAWLSHIEADAYCLEKRVIERMRVISVTSPDAVF